MIFNYSDKRYKVVESTGISEHHKTSAKSYVDRLHQIYSE